MLIGAGEANAELLFNEPATRRDAGAAQPEGLARILAGCFVARRSKVKDHSGVFSLLAPHNQTKFAAALLYEPQTWCTRSALPLPRIPRQQKNMAKS